MQNIGFLFWISYLTTFIHVQALPPPQITNFLQGNLLNRDEVKGGKEYWPLSNLGFKLPCEATGQDLKWRWEHNGTEIFIFSGGRYKLQGGSLIGEFLYPEQSGTYQCFVQDTVTLKETFSRRVQVFVTYLRRFHSSDGQTLTVDLGQSLRIPCPAHGESYGATFSWTGSDNMGFDRNSRRAILPDGELFIMFVLDEDITAAEALKGIRCTMTGASSVYRSGPITLKKRRPGMVDPGTKRSPSWIVTPGSAETAVEGRNKILYCFANGRPPPTITWKKNGQIILTGEYFDIAATYLGRRLELINVKKNIHQGIYTCEAENSQNSGNPRVFATTLTVEAGPKWKDSKPPPEKLEIDLQGNGKLLCDAIGIPAPAFTWYKNGKRIVSSTSYVQMTRPNELTFQNVRLEWEDGLYQCIAANNVDMIVSSTWVNVIEKAPSFKFESGPFTLFIGSDGRLNCEPDAAPQPTFEWSKVSGDNQGDITPGGRYKLFSNGTLIIANVMQSDEGRYKCKATNLLGSASSTAEANVLDINECTEYKPCSSNSVCINLPGSYQCKCNDGYKMDDNNNCVDRDECKEDKPCSSNSVCINLVGSYQCKCNDGYKMDNDNKCVDVDECKEYKPCSSNSVCINLPGVYQCKCNDGYKMDNNNYCVDIDECMEYKPCPSNSVCINFPGSHQCKCNDGYKMDNNNCVDVDECSELESPCNVNEVCENQQATFNCFCAAGYTRTGGGCVKPGRDVSSQVCDCREHFVCHEGKCWCKDGYSLCTRLSSNWIGASGSGCQETSECPHSWSTWAPKKNRGCSLLCCC